MSSLSLVDPLSEALQAGCHMQEVVVHIVERVGQRLQHTVLLLLVAMLQPLARRHHPLQLRHHTLILRNCFLQCGWQIKLFSQSGLSHSSLYVNALLRRLQCSAKCHTTSYKVSTTIRRHLEVCNNAAQEVGGQDDRPRQLVAHRHWQRLALAQVLHPRNTDISSTSPSTELSDD